MKTEYKSYLISSGNNPVIVRGFPNDKKDTAERFKHIITVKNKDTGLSVRFNFYDSVKSFQDNIRILSAQDLLNAFECFISDGICALSSFADFCSDLGYDEDSRSAEKIYRLCVKSLAKLEKIGITEDNIYNFINELQDQEIESL